MWREYAYKYLNRTDRKCLGTKEPTCTVPTQKSIVSQRPTPGWWAVPWCTAANRRLPSSTGTHWPLSSADECCWPAPHCQQGPQQRWGRRRGNRQTTILAFFKVLWVLQDEPWLPNAKSNHRIGQACRWVQRTALLIVQQGRQALNSS